MGEHDTWLSFFVPPIKDLEISIAEGVGKSWIFGKTVTDVHHVTMGILTFVILMFLAFRFRSALRADPQGAVIPESTFNVRSLIEVICDYTYGTMSGVMGEKAARHFLPFEMFFATDLSSSLNNFGSLKKLQRGAAAV